MNLSVTRTIKILIVEDDVFMQAILEEILSSTYSIEMRSNGLDALAFLQNGNIPDLVIADLNTPKLNGLQLIEQVKVSDFFNSVPIIILSGEESSDKRIKWYLDDSDLRIQDIFTYQRQKINFHSA